MARIDSRVRRVYEPQRRVRGRTVLVDRVWPRGIKKEKLGADLWLREISSSEELGKWFGNRPDRPERDRRPCSTELTTTR
jgi:uncharacterized protein YeaO (DUF488 family)